MSTEGESSDKRELYLLIGKIVVPVIIIIAAYIFLPRPTKLENREHNITNQNLVIIPTSGIPPRFKQVIEAELEKAHGFDVLTSTEMGIDDAWKLENGQMNSHRLAAYGTQVFRSLNRPGSYCIVLTNEDINAPDSGLRFTFANYYEGIAVVSLARLNPKNLGVSYGFFSIPMMFQKTTERSLKLLNRALGRGYYGMQLSTDRSSVMCSPVMSLTDLDSIGAWYTEKDNEQISLANGAHAPRSSRD